MTADLNEKRLAVVLRAASDDLLKYFLRRLNREDAADALADVMTTAWIHLDSLPHDPQEARMWLFGIARNVVLHAQRGNIRRAKLANRMRLVLSNHTAPPADAGVDVRDALDRLDPELTELVRLVHWDGFSLVDSAKLLGIPASTARGRYQKARSRLRELLSPVSSHEYSR